VGFNDEDKYDFDEEDLIREVLTMLYKIKLA
jgi:hypothetical protein